MNDGRSYIAGGRETKDQILTRAGRRCRRQSREITAGVGCGEENQGTSKHVCFRGLFTARSVQTERKKKKITHLPLVAFFFLGRVPARVDAPQTAR